MTEQEENASKLKDEIPESSEMKSSELRDRLLSMQAEMAEKTKISLKQIGKSLSAGLSAAERSWARDIVHFLETPHRVEKWSQKKAWETYERSYHTVNLGGGSKHPGSGSKHQRAYNFYNDLAKVVSPASRLGKRLADGFRRE